MWIAGCQARAPKIADRIRADVRRLFSELNYADAPPQERLLIEQVVVIRIDLEITRLDHTNRQWEARAGGRNLRAREVDRLGRQHMRALEALNRMRVLSKRAPIQLNVAQHQVNTL